MKLSVALVSLLSVVLASPVPVDGIGLSDLISSNNAVDVPGIVGPVVHLLKARDGDDSAAVKTPGKALADDINKSIGTQLNARQVQELAIIVDYTLGLGENAIGEASDALPAKPDLSPAEIMANARKALSAAESDNRKYPNEITQAAYLNAIETVRGLTKLGN